MFDRIESILIVMAHQVLSDDYCSLEKCLENDLPFSASVRMGLRLSISFHVTLVTFRFRPSLSVTFSKPIKVEYGTPIHINVEKSTLQSKYFLRFRMFNFYNILPQNTLSFSFRKVKTIKAQAVFELVTNIRS